MLSLYRVNPIDGTLQNVESFPNDDNEMKEFLEEPIHTKGPYILKNKFFQGGNYRILHSMLGIQNGGHLLYVGDHIYSDIVRSKRKLGWRTCLIVPELSDEITVHRRATEARQTLMSMRRDQFLLENEVDRMYQALYELRQKPRTEMDVEKLEKRLATVTRDLIQVREELRHRFTAFDLQFHPRWGQIFKAGFQDSSISKQIQDFACIYTSKASNLGFVSPLRPFRPPRDKMSHDHLLEGLQ